DREGRDLIHRGGSEREVRDDAEVAAAAAAQGPEEVPVLGRGTVDGDSRREHDASGAEPVAGHAELPRREAYAAAERQPGDADGGAAAGRNRKSVLPEGLVDVDQPRTGADGRGAAGGVDPHAGDAAPVDHDP